METHYKTSVKQPFSAILDDIGSKPCSMLVFDLLVKRLRNIGGRVHFILKMQVTH